MDSLAIAHLENNELRQRVLELEEILRGKVAAMKELNKENFELKSKVVASKSAERQSATASPILHNEIEELQQTLYNKQKALDEIHKENQDLRVKLSSTGSNSKSESSQIEELRGKLTSKQNTLEMLSQQNEQLVKEIKELKEKSSDLSFGSDSAQIESMQENLKTKQMILSELNKQNQELGEKLTGAQRELDVKEDEIERLKANEVTLVQTRELLRETSAELRTAQSEISRLKETIDQQQGALIQELVERDNKIAELQNMYNALSSGREEHSLKVSHCTEMNCLIFCFKRRLLNPFRLREGCFLALLMFFLTVLKQFGEGTFQTISVNIYSKVQHKRNQI